MSDQNEDQTEAELERTRQAIADTAALAEDITDDDIVTEDDEEIDTGWAVYTKDELVEECRNRGLAVSGNKDELVERLDDDDRESGA